MGAALSGLGAFSDSTARPALQFQADRHLVGFWPTKVYFAALDHTLSVEFLGTAGVMPQALAGPASTVKPGERGGGREGAHPRHLL